MLSSTAAGDGRAFADALPQSTVTVLSSVTV
jgi:hypothetical protein